MKIQIDINNCDQCPNIKKTRVRTNSSWDEVYGWYCTESDLLIDGYVEWNDVKNMIIPDWCPCLLTKIK